VPITVAGVIGTPANNSQAGFFDTVIGIAKKLTNVLRKNLSDGHMVAKFLLYLANVEMSRSDVKQGRYLSTTESTALSSKRINSSEITRR